MPTDLLSVPPSLIRFVFSNLSISCDILFLQYSVPESLMETLLWHLHPLLFWRPWRRKIVQDQADGQEFLVGDMPQDMKRDHNEVNQLAQKLCQNQVNAMCKCSFGRQCRHIRSGAQCAPKWEWQIVPITYRIDGTLNNCKIMRFNFNGGLNSVKLSKNTRLILESLFIPTINNLSNYINIRN